MINEKKKIVINIGKEVLVYVPGKLLPALFGFIGVSVYTRILSPTEYGDYALLMAIINIIGLISYSWLSQSNLRFFSTYKENNIHIFITTTFVTLVSILSIVSAALLLIYKWSLISNSISSYLFETIGVLISTAFFEISTNILRANRKSKYVSSSLILSAGLSLVSSLMLIYYFNIGISAIFIGIIGANSILTIFLLLRFNAQKYIKLMYFSKAMLKEFLNYGVPIIITLIFSWILSLSDRYQIAYFKGSNAVGIYSATYQLASYPLLLVSSTLIFAAFPIIIDTWNINGKIVTEDLIKDITRYYLLITIPIVVGMTILSKELMWILGNDYSNGYIVLPLICLGSAISGLCVYVNKGLELTNNTRVLSFIVGIAGTCNILLNLILIPRYSYYGAGIATTIAYFIYLILSIVLSTKYLKWRINVASALRTTLSALMMGVVLIYAKSYFKQSFMTLGFLMTIGAIVYFIALLITNEITKEIFLLQKKKYQ